MRYSDLCMFGFSLKCYKNTLSFCVLVQCKRVHSMDSQIWRKSRFFWLTSFPFSSHPSFEVWLVLQVLCFQLTLIELKWDVYFLTTKKCGVKFLFFYRNGPVVDFFCPSNMVCVPSKPSHKQLQCSRGGNLMQMPMRGWLYNALPHRWTDEEKNQNCGRLRNEPKKLES